jgi:mono/diheme cytochrome c family protein
MKKNKYLLLVSSLGVLALLVVAAVQEHYLRQWRVIQRRARSEEGPVPVQLRQIVNVRLGLSDRCVSCHVSMAPGEQSATGAEVLAPHKPVVHDPAEFGCTPCHGGQGQATLKEDAHGEVPFWPEPMIPQRFSQAGCGTCHVPLGVPNREQYERARLAFERLDCLACHRVDGRGGTLRPGGGGMEGPDLSRVGLTGYDADWYAKHLKKSAEASAGPWRDSFAPLTEADRELVAVYLSARVAAPDLVAAKAVFHSSGCLGCHKVSGVGGDEGPELTRAGEKDPGRLDFSAVPGPNESLAAWFAEHFRSPVAVVAESQMPPVALSDGDVDLLTLYMLSLRRRTLPGEYVPKDRVRAEKFGEREFASEGATIFTAFCSGCHGPAGQGKRALGTTRFPANAHPDFLRLVSDEFLIETIRRGRPGTRMPAWGEKEGGLRPEEIRLVAAHLRRLGGVAHQPENRPLRWISSSPAAGEALFASACSGCHGRRGEGGVGPALNNPVLLATATDSYLVETIRQGRSGTPMTGFLEPTPTRPALTQAEIEAIVAYIRSWEGGKK